MKKYLLLTDIVVLGMMAWLLSNLHPRSVAVACPDPAAIEQIRQDSRRIASLFEQCLPEMRSRLPGFTPDELFSIYAMQAANGLAPYGPDTASSIDELLTAPRISCMSYAKLLIYFQQYYGDTKTYLVLWEGGVYTSHAQVIACKDRCLLLDPTVNVLAVASIDDALNRRISGRQIYDLSRRPNMEAERNLVVNALMYHRLRSADLRAYVYVKN